MTYNKWGQFGKDFEEGINFDRLRRERLQKAREAIGRHGLGAIVATTLSNIRYITGSVGMAIEGAIFRYVVLPIEGEPILFEGPGELPRVRESAPWLAGRLRVAVPLAGLTLVPEAGKGAERVRKEMQEQFANSIKEVLDANGVGNERVGFDFYDAAMLEPLENANINFIDGRAAMFDARYIKTQDELQLLRIASQIADAGFYRMEEVIRPGMREVEVWGETVGTMIALGADRVRGICTSGGRTNPYYRPPAGTDRILSPGDLLISDIVASYMGYSTCVVRTFLVGDKPTSEQKALYRKCYDSLYSAINTCKAGVWTDKIAETFPKRGPEDLSLNVGHGLGLDVHELPHIAPMEYAKDFTIQLQPNVYLAIETYAGEAGGSQGVRLEDDFVVTEEGCEVFSRYPYDERML